MSLRRRAVIDQLAVKGYFVGKIAAEFSGINLGSIRSAMDEQRLSYSQACLIDPQTQNKQGGCLALSDKERFIDLKDLLDFKRNFIQNYRKRRPKTGSLVTRME